MKKLSSKDKTIHDQFARYGKNAKEWMNKCVLMLPKIEKNRIWAKKGFGSIYEYAAKIAGMSRHKVDDSLRIIRKIEDRPKLLEIAKTKGLNSVRPVVTIVTKVTEEFWAKRAMEMSKNTLATYVKDYKNEQTNLVEKSRPGTRSPAINDLERANDDARYTLAESSKIQISMKLDPEIFVLLKNLKGNADWNELMKKLLQYSQKELESEKENLEKEKPPVARTRSHGVTIAIKRYIHKRSKGKCEHPNCNKSGKHIHHIEPFAVKKEHNPDKLLYLCEEHHKIIHLGYIDDDVKSLKQIDKLPFFDIKNLVNQRINEFKQQYV